MKLQFYFQFLIVAFIRHAVGVPFSTEEEFLPICQPPNFRCYDGSCIPEEWVCDGTEECLHGEDEHCIKDKYLTVPDDQQIRKRSQDYFSHSTDIHDEAIRLIISSNQALEKGVSHIAETPSLDGKKIIKRQQDETQLEEFEGTTSVSQTSFDPDATDTTTSDFTTDSDITDTNTTTDVVETFTTSTQEGVPTVISDPTASVTTESLTSTIHSMLSTLIDGNLTTIMTDIPEETTPAIPLPDSLQEKLLILEEIIRSYNSLKDWIEKEFNNTHNDNKCPPHTTTEPSATSTEPTTITSTKEPLTITKITCPYHFQFMNGICIYVQIYPPVSWFEASALCSAQLSDLIRIDSKELFEKLLKQLNFDKMRVYDFWIGATNHNANGRWSWTDGTPVNNFDAWGFNLHPNNPDYLLSYNKPHQCGFLDGKLYSYVNGASCYEPKGFVCQFRPRYRDVYYYTSVE